MNDGMKPRPSGRGDVTEDEHRSGRTIDPPPGVNPVFRRHDTYRHRVEQAEDIVHDLLAEIGAGPAADDPLELRRTRLVAERLARKAYELAVWLADPATAPTIAAGPPGERLATVEAPEHREQGEEP